ncbi:MAG: helix-turn-helix domain-containing protein [Deltaproteobacteria bacterium]|jgi:cytoskeletal protein RodZ|nr:helix-turn-helix domain-containing protein [Deltaproteobacteria bacterium]
MKAPATADETALEALGRYLKEEREKACLTRSDVSSRTKISIDQITCLEEGRFSKMAAVYARGFLRSYCELLSLDTDSVMGEFKRLTRGHEEDNTKIIKHVPNNLGSLEPRGHAWAALGLIVLLAGLLAAGLYISPSLKKTVIGLLPEAVVTKLALAESPAPARPAAPQNGQAAAAAKAAAPPAPVQAAAPAQEPAETVPETYSGKLTLRAEASTWAQVTVDDKPVEHLLFEAGQLHSFEGETLITVVCGDGRALRTEWNGQDRGPLGSEGPVEVFFNLSPGGPSGGASS